MNDCYCGRSIPYISCCGKIHKDIMNAETAEDLMRSRYVAYVLAKGEYLMKSHHSSTRPTKEKKSIVSWAKSVKWMELDVLTVSKGGKNDKSGSVEFKAFYYDSQGVQMIHENSQFIRENGYWVYLGAV